jgi:hypothetical protein
MCWFFNRLAESLFIDFLKIEDGGDVFSEDFQVI